jgi:hypothetical protein
MPGCLGVWISGFLGVRMSGCLGAPKPSNKPSVLEIKGFQDLACKSHNMSNSNSHMWESKTTQDFKEHGNKKSVSVCPPPIIRLTKFQGLNSLNLSTQKQRMLNMFEKPLAEQILSPWDSA